MNLILFDDPIIRANLLPFTFTRPVAAIRIGIVTIREKWENIFSTQASISTQAYLQHKFLLQTAAENLWVNGALCPDKSIVTAIQALEFNQTLVQGNIILAARREGRKMPDENNTIEYSEVVTLIDHSWKIFQYNAAQIKEDFGWLTNGRKSKTITDKHTIVYAPENIFIEEGANIKAAILNAETGSIYIGKNAVIQEGSLVRGSFALCEGATLNMGAKMRGDSTIGPYCKVGGEISNSVLFGYTNKAHDGFLGNSVLGEWCNLGADTNTSNLKNNYSHVKLWSYAKNEYVNTAAQFCGLMMGDHSKCGINTMFNTGTVVGVSANVYGGGYPPTFIPSFSWGGADGFAEYQLQKAIETIQRVMARRGTTLTTQDKEILKYIAENTKHQ